MRTFVRTLIILALCYVGYIVLTETKGLYSADNPDPTKIILSFLVLLAIGITIGFIVAVSVVPAIGEQIGSFFFTPNVAAEKNPHAAALAKINRGDYAGAVAAYVKVVEKHPGDTHAISEAARLQCEKLHQPEEAATFLEQTLERDWEMGDLAFIANRLVDVYWTHLQDAERARPILEQLVEQMPETKHSANAAHRLRDIDLALQELPAPESE